MKILLINPPRFRGSSVIREMRCVGLTTVSVFPPITMAYLAGVLRKYAQVKILDANALNQSFEDVEKEIESLKPEAIIFTASLPSFSADAQIAKIAKRINSGIKTILLDSYITPVNPESIRQNFPEIDYLVGNDPLMAIPELLGFPGVLELADYPLPAYDLLPITKYSSLSFTRKKPFATLITSVGCPNRCNFCIIGGATVDRGYGKIWKFKSPQKILEEIKYLLSFGVKGIYFFDETFTVDRQRVKNLCRLIIDQGLKFEWACNGRVDSLDEETIKIMKQAGCWNIMFGLECGSEEMLDDSNKGTTLSKSIDIIKCCKNNGLMVTVCFMIGFPKENWETIKQTLDVAKKINVHRTQFNILTPYPGTAFYEEIKKKGLLERDYSFSGYDSNCLNDPPVVRTENLTSQELIKAHKYIYRRFYLRPFLWIHTVLGIRTFSQILDILKFVKYLK